MTHAETVQAFVPASPFAARLGLEVVAIGDDRAELRMPWRPEHATMGDVVHGGAVAALADTAGMAAAWADDGDEPRGGGATVSLSVNYVAAARACDLTAIGRAVRRGRSLCFVEVEVLGDEGVVATAQLVHRFA
jgi:uncharacterized protein (TIGR00369 family)